MSESDVAIIGSGITGLSCALKLTQQGYRVAVFEKGPPIPYPHAKLFVERYVHDYSNPAYKLPADLDHVELSGEYQHSIRKERALVVGGAATHWGGVTSRMHAEDFRTRTLFGYGQDWPLDYDELEPYYCLAEEQIGVSGTTEDNPYAPFRSRPYPLPPFDLSYDDEIMAERLRADGLALHTTPQARARLGYDSRPGCANYGTCRTCPIGARYSPNHHLPALAATGLFELKPRTSVRRIVAAPGGAGASLIYSSNDGSKEHEHSARIIVVAAGGFETPRLLLNSRDERNPDGLGNHSGHVGRNLVFHHMWSGKLRYQEQLYPARFGGFSGCSDQFVNHDRRGRSGGFRVEFTSPRKLKIQTKMGPEGVEIEMQRLREAMSTRTIMMHAESVADPGKYVALSKRKDRFGDAFAQVHYQSCQFDLATHNHSMQILRRFAAATRGEVVKHPAVGDYHSGAHHMAACRMSNDPAAGVVDRHLRVHGTHNVFILGGASFGGCSGAAHPTLTMVALALRAADFMRDQVLI